MPQCFDYARLRSAFTRGHCPESSQLLEIDLSFHGSIVELNSTEMKILTQLCTLFLSAVAYGQKKIPVSETPALPSWMPRPIVYGEPSLVGNGYHNVALNGGAGLLLTSSKLIGEFEGRYMNARKTNDTVNNWKGHEGFLEGRIFYKYRPGLFWT